MWALSDLESSVLLGLAEFKVLDLLDEIGTNPSYPGLVRRVRRSSDRGVLDLVQDTMKEEADALRSFLAREDIPG